MKTCDNYTVAQLKTIAQKKKIRGRSTMNKSELCKALRIPKGAIYGHKLSKKKPKKDCDKYYIGELKKLAQQKNIPGRSTMNKAELCRALQIRPGKKYNWKVSKSSKKSNSKKSSKKPKPAPKEPKSSKKSKKSSKKPVKKTSSKSSKKPRSKKPQRRKSPYYDYVENAVRGYKDTIQVRYNVSQAIGGIYDEESETYIAKENQEDTFAIYETEDILILGVFDGHAGPNTSELLSSRMPNLLHRNLKKLKDKDEISIGKTIEKTFVQFDEFLNSKGIEDGSTVNLIIIFDNKIISVNLGDSRSIIFDKKQIIFSTKDHDPEDPKEKRRIEAAGGYVTPSLEEEGEIARLNGNIAMSRAMGDHGEKHFENGKYISSQSPLSNRPDIHFLLLRQYPDFYVLMGSDGLFDMVKNEDWIKYIRGHEGQNDLAREIVKEAVNAQSEEQYVDNTTCIFAHVRRTEFPEEKEYESSSEEEEEEEEEEEVQNPYLQEPEESDLEESEYEEEPYYEGDFESDYESDEDDEDFYESPYEEPYLSARDLEQIDTVPDILYEPNLEDLDVYNIPPPIDYGKPVVRIEEVFEDPGYMAELD